MEREWCDNLGTECLNINSDFSELRQSFCKRIFLLGRFRSIFPVFTIFLFSDCLYTSCKQKGHLTTISAKYSVLCSSSRGWQKVSRSFQTKPFWKCVHEHVFCVRKNYCRCVFISKWISVTEMDPKYLAETSANSVFSRGLYLNQRAAGRVRRFDFRSAQTFSLTVPQRFCRWNSFSISWATPHGLSGPLLISRDSQKIRNHQKWDLTKTFYFPTKFIEWTIRFENFKS